MDQLAGLRIPERVAGMGSISHRKGPKRARSVSPVVVASEVPDAKRLIAHVHDLWGATNSLINTPGTENIVHKWVNFDSLLEECLTTIRKMTMTSNHQPPTKRLKWDPNTWLGPKDKAHSLWHPVVFAMDELKDLLEHLKAWVTDFQEIGKKNNLKLRLEFDKMTDLKNQVDHATTLAMIIYEHSIGVWVPTAWIGENKKTVASASLGVIALGALAGWGYLTFGGAAAGSSIETMKVLELTKTGLSREHGRIYEATLSNGINEIQKRVISINKDNLVITTKPINTDLNAQGRLADPGWLNWILPDHIQAKAWTDSVMQEDKARIDDLLMGDAAV